MTEEVEDLETLPTMAELTLVEQVRRYPPPGWLAEFAKADDVLAEISAKVKERGRYWPLPKYVFHVFRICPLYKVKVVILGQDLYPDERDAWGVSFSTAPGGKIRPSLNNIFCELERTVEGYRRPRDGCLLHWAEQGVFLLNYCLTYHPDQPLKGKELGLYNDFIRVIVEAICEVNCDAVFVLWGKKAEVIEPFITGCKVIKGVHPSPMAGNRFVGCGHFLEVNAHLEATGQEPIRW